MIRKIFIWALIIVLVGVCITFGYCSIYMTSHHIYDARAVQCYITSILAAYAAAKVYYTEFKE